MRGLRLLYPTAVLSIAKIEAIFDILTADTPASKVGPDRKRDRVTDIHPLRTHRKIQLLSWGWRQNGAWWPRPDRSDDLDVRASRRLLSRGGWDNQQEQKRSKDDYSSQPERSGKNLPAALRARIIGSLLHEQAFMKARALSLVDELRARI